MSTYKRIPELNMIILFSRHPNLSDNEFNSPEIDSNKIKFDRKEFDKLLSNYYIVPEQKETFDDNTKTFWRTLVLSINITMILTQET